MSGLIIAAPSSGSGKTTITLGLLRALRDRGVKVRGAKSGPDYIDPMFHHAACGETCVNLDAWAMTPERIAGLSSGDGLLIIEGAMGLFDGAPPDGKGSVADLARQLRLPVVLVVDASHMAQSAGALVNGFARHDPEIEIAGVILNKLGSVRHEQMVRRAVDLPVLGAVHRSSELATPSRHLGLVQAQEIENLEGFLTRAAKTVAAGVDLDAVAPLAAPVPKATKQPAPEVTRTIAIARDAAFSFIYPHFVTDLQNSGWDIKFFSPLDDDPVPTCDRVFLPGGYPELHAARLANASNFKGSLNEAAQSIEIYGECGGYMTLGEVLVDADGQAHKMAGLLPLETSFAARKLHLGYRVLRAAKGAMKGIHKGHEFHYASTLRADGTPLFEAQNAEGDDLPAMGLIEGNVCGSFAHIIEHGLP